MTAGSRSAKIRSMPSSRSAKEICQAEGEGSISCNVAKDMERRRASEGRSTPAAPPAAREESKPRRSPLDRGGQLEDKMKDLGI